MDQHHRYSFTPDERSARRIYLAVQASCIGGTHYSLISKLLPKLSTYGSVDYQDLLSVEALPDLAILLVNYDPDTEIGRHVLWHYVRAADQVPSFHYSIDPARWINEKPHVLPPHVIPHGISDIVL